MDNMWKRKHEYFDKDYKDTTDIHLNFIVGNFLLLF